MNTSASFSDVAALAVRPSPAAPARLAAPAASSSAPDGRLREVFDEFVGQSFYQQMLGAMRKTVEKPAYFHGGRAEEIFQGQLDQVLSEKMSAASAAQFTGPMFDLFMLERR